MDYLKLATDFLQPYLNRNETFETFCCDINLMGGSLINDKGETFGWLETKKPIVKIMNKNWEELAQFTFQQIYNTKKQPRLL